MVLTLRGLQTWNNPSFPTDIMNNMNNKHLKVVNGWIKSIIWSFSHADIMKHVQTALKKHIQNSNAGMNNNNQ